MDDTHTHTHSGTPIYDIPLAKNSSPRPADPADRGDILASLLLSTTTPPSDATLAADASYAAANSSRMASGSSAAVDEVPKVVVVPVVSFWLRRRWVRPAMVRVGRESVRGGRLCCIGAVSAVPLSSRVASTAVVVVVVYTMDVGLSNVVKQAQT